MATVDRALVIGGVQHLEQAEDGTSRPTIHPIPETAIAVVQSTGAEAGILVDPVADTKQPVNGLRFAWELLRL